MSTFTQTFATAIASGIVTVAGEYVIREFVTRFVLSAAIVRVLTLLPGGDRPRRVRRRVARPRRRVRVPVQRVRRPKARRGR